MSFQIFGHSIFFTFLSYNWIFRETYKLIDYGGVYRLQDPIHGPAKPPQLDVEEAQERYHLNKTLVQHVIAATDHPKFIKNLAIKFIEEVMGLEIMTDRGQYEFAGAHFRFNPGDFFASDFLKRDEYANAGNHMHKTVSVHIHRSLTKPGYKKLINIERKK